MRNDTLINLRLSLKGECGINLDSGVAMSEDKRYNVKLANMQQWLWSQHQWPFLYGHEDIAIVPGQRFYNFPTTISMDYPTTAEVEWDTIWTDVTYGIKGPQYEVVNPELNQTLDPVARWQNYSQTQFEVWPPPTTAQKLRFWGTQNLTPLVADTDKALLDNLLIVLFTGAELLARSKQRDAQSLAGRAQKLFLELTGVNRPNMIFRLGGEEQPPSRRYQRVIGIVGNTNH